MRLKKLVQIQEKSGRPVIRLSLKRGVFTITKPAVRKLKISDKTEFLEIFNDEDDEKNFFICGASSGFKIRDDKKLAGCMFLNSSFLKNELKRIFKIQEMTAIFVVGSEIEYNGQIIYPLIYDKK